MRRVYLESPYAGDVHANVAYARECVMDCLRRGESAYASHLFFTQPGILDDTIPEQRALGIQAGLAWAEAADATVVYMDLGVSQGMQIGIYAANKAGRPIEWRWLRKSTEVIVRELEELQFGWLKTALLKCGYLEDVQALRHFVFHARLNGASNTCLLCLRSCDEDDEGHLADCPYLVALERVSAPGVETLVEWADRQ
jgi:hypothetical protein